VGKRYRLRVWLPDRPGALGLVASRIGAVGGDIVAVDILERSEGRAVDEFIVELPTDSLVALLRTEVHEVDGATVEEVTPVGPVETSAAPEGPLR
jgi:UTP:GlnB (protein PII) uridylyltransferase